MLSQVQLRLADTPVDEGGGRDQQTRILRRGLDVAGIGGIGTVRIADQCQMIADRPPGVGQRRLEGHGATPRRQGRARLGAIGEAHAELVVGGRPVGLRGRERL